VELIILIIIIAVLAVVSAGALLLAPVRRRRALRRPAARRVQPRLDRQPGVDHRPGVGDDAEVPRDTWVPGVATLDLPSDPEPAVELPGTPAGDVPGAAGLLLDEPPPGAGRLVRLRSRLSRSQGALGRGLFALLSRDTLDEDTWEEVEDTLLTADLGVAATQQVVGNLRQKVKVLGTRTPTGLRELLEGELLQVVGSVDRTLSTHRKADGKPAVVLVVGVNGTGKTTTCGKLARVLVGDGQSVVLGAADTFRAAAADQLTTWGERVGATVVRGPEQSDPASVAFEAVQTGVVGQIDCVVIDTAGRLHTKTGLMDELGKVKRVVEKITAVDEVLLVLDATTGQNGVVQAKQFLAAVAITGIVLTKLDGTAKGGIVVAVQRELGIPVKLIGLGEGPDDLAPFEPAAFVDALLGDVGLVGEAA